MNKRFATITATIFSAFIIAPAAQALPLVDIHLKANSWQTEYSGDIGQGDNTVSFADLGFEQEQTTSFSLTLRHSVPLIPNFKIQQTTLDTEAEATLDVGQILELTDITFNDDVQTNLDLSHTDFTIFYSILYFDFGLTGRTFDTESTIEGSTESATVSLSGTVPMAYLGLDADLPFTGLYINADLNTVSYEGNSLQDLSAALGYKVSDTFPLTAEVGYRKMNLSLEELDDLEGDFSIAGWFFSLGLDF